MSISVKTSSLCFFIFVSLSSVLTGCMNSTTTSEPEIKPIVQDGKLRFPEGHVQLQLIKTKAGEEAKTFAMDLPARLVWDEERTQRVYAPFAGRVLQIKADLGSLVSKGSPLLLLSSPEFGAAQSDLAKSLADVSVAEKAFSRQRELFEAGVTPKKDLEQAQADYERANAENERALSKIRLYGGGQLVNQQLVLSSDLNGVVVQRNVNPGQEVRPEQFGPGSPALFVVTDPSRLWVQIDAKETDLGTLKPGAIFELSISVLAGQKFKGTVIASSDFIDSNTRTIKIRGSINNASRVLKAEMLGTMRMERNLGSGVVVPTTAVYLKGSKHIIFVQIAPGTFEFRDVDIGFESPYEVVISSGLKKGELVVYENGLLLAREFSLAMDTVSHDGLKNIQALRSVVNK